MPATHRKTGRVEDYTTAFLVTAALITFMALFVIAASKGMIYMLLAAAVMEGLIRLQATRIRAREVRKDR